MGLVDDHPHEWPAPLQVLEHRTFRWLWIATFVSNSGSWMQRVATAWLVYTLANSEAWLGFDAALAALPAVILLPISGFLADRFDRRIVLIGANALNSLLALLLAVIWGTGHLAAWQLLASSFLASIVTSLSAPASQAQIPGAAGEDHIPNAIALNSFQYNVARAVGPAVGGLVLASLGAGWCFALNALSYLGLIGAVMALPSDSIAVVAGSNSLRFNTPLTASGGDTFARFRLSTAGGLSPLGAATDGEVEDYAIKVVSSTQPGAFVIPDPENPTRGLLVINGTAGTDIIRVISTGGANGRTIVVAPMTSSLLMLNSSIFDRVLVRGGGGVDLILFSPDFNKPATIYGDAGADVIIAGAGNDTIYGGAGIDTVRGGGGNDQIFGEGDIDFLYGEAGNDLIQGGDGGDYIYGGAGADVLVGGNGSDFIYGDTGDDLIIGARWKYDLDPTTLAAILQTWGSSSPFTTRVSALGSRLHSSSLSDDGTFDYIWTGSGRDWVHDAALRDLLLDFNYNVTNGDKRN